MPEPRSKLPSGMPQELVDFVRCRVDQVEISAGKLDWLPKPPGGMIPDTPPEVTFESGPGGSINIRAGWGFVGMTVNVAIVDGNATVTSDNPLVPKQALKDFQDNLNSDLRDNGKEFAAAEILRGKLKLTKRLIGAGGKQASKGAVKAAAVHAAAIPTQPAVEVAATTPILGPRASSNVRDFVAWFRGRPGVTVGALALGAAAFFLFMDREDTPTDLPPTTSPATTSSQPTAGGQVGAVPCDSTPKATQLVAAVANDATLGGVATGAWPNGPIIADPAFHVPCDRYGTGMWRTPMRDAAFQQQFTRMGIVLAGPGQVTVSHSDGSVPDAATGETGLSLSSYGFPSNLSLSAEYGNFQIRHEYICAGKTITGAGTAMNGLVTGSGPLFQYGPCTTSRVYGMFDGLEFLFAGMPLPDFVVNDNESTLDETAIRQAWSTDAHFTPQALAEMLFPATFVRESFIGSTPTADTCAWSIRADALTGVLSTTDCNGWDYWTLTGYGGDGHPGLFGSGGPEIAASGTGTTDPSASYMTIGHLLFANTVYHCGPGRVAYTVCATDGSIVPEGPWTLVQVALTESIELEPSAEFVVGIGFDLDGNAATGDAFGAGESGGVEVEYRITGGADGLWTLIRSDGAATTARALLADNSLTLVVSSSEIAGATGYRTYAMEGANGTALPAVSSPPISTSTSPLPVVTMVEEGGTATTTTTVVALTPAEQIEAFLVEFNAATANSDVDFLVGRLHPAVFTLFDEETCRAFIESDILVLSNYQVTGDITGPTVTSIGGQEVTGYLTAPVSFVISGETFEQEGAFALLDGQVYWFTQCG